MKANINGIEVQGTPSEIMEFNKLMEGKKEMLEKPMRDNPLFIGYKPINILKYIKIQQ